MSAFLDYSTVGATPRNPGAVKSTRNPTTSDVITSDGAPMPVGRLWVNTVTDGIFIYAGAGVWITLSSSASGPIDTLTGDSGTATPVAGNIQIAGTVNQISTLASGSTITLSLPTPMVVPGSLVATTTLSATTSILAGTGITSTTGNITATNGNLVLSTAGDKIVIATGANASAGTSAAMSGTPGAVTVSTTACSSTALIFYSRATTGGTPGQVSITAQSGSGFTLTSTGNETSTFNWWIINL